jgi:hypothetical protein
MGKETRLDANPCTSEQNEAVFPEAVSNRSAPPIFCDVIFRRKTMEWTERQTFGYVTPCSLVDGYKYFREGYSLRSLL